MKSIELSSEQKGELKTVFKDGKIIKRFTLEEVRNNL